MSNNPANAPFLSDTAVAIGNGRLVPRLIELIDIAEPNVSPPNFPAQRALQSLTYEIADHGKPAWRQWYAGNGKLARSAWLERTIDDLRELLADDEVAALSYFESRIHVLNSIDLLAFVEEELEPRPVFASAIAGWINMTYTCALRPRLSALASRIAQRPEQLEGWARDLLRGLGFLGRQSERTWASYVRESNVRI